MDKKLLILFRGVAGAGKTSLATALCSHCFAADDYFMKNGHYHFDANKLGEAHEDCQNKVKQAMEYHVSPIAVHNTLTTEKELKPYLDLAKEFGYTVHSVIVERRHDGENVHNVPASVIQKMENRFSIKL